MEARAVYHRSIIDGRWCRAKNNIVFTKGSAGHGETASELSHVDKPEATETDLGLCHGYSRSR